MHDLVGEAVDEVPVMGHEHDRPVEFKQRPQKHILGSQIQVIGRLVQQQEVAGLEQHSR